MYTIHRYNNRFNAFNTFFNNPKFIIMKKNMGSTDRIIRILLAMSVGILYWQNIIQGTLAYVLLTLAGVFVLTSFVSFCPLYRLVGTNTCKTK